METWDLLFYISAPRLGSYRDIIELRRQSQDILIELETFNLFSPVIYDGKGSPILMTTTCVILKKLRKNEYICKYNFDKKLLKLSVAAKHRLLKRFTH